MSVLLLRLAGPMQSWGTQSRFSNRDTGLEPSKSGVIGLLCAALGWQREQCTCDNLPGSPTIEQFARSLTMAVRIDRAGQMYRDYHTVGGEHSPGSVLGFNKNGKPIPYGVAKSDGSKAGAVVSERFYLADADFLVGLQGGRGLLERLDTAVRDPVWPLFLGRKSFVPGRPVAVGVFAGEMLSVLSSQPWLKRRRWEEAPARVQLVIETPFGQGPEVRQDVPTGFDKESRRHGHCTIRHVEIRFVPDAERDLTFPNVEEDPCLLPQNH